jgi:hypothetical protein
LQQRYYSYQEEQTANCLWHGVGHVVRFNNNIKGGQNDANPMQLILAKRSSGMVTIGMSMPCVELDVSPTQLHNLYWLRINSESIRVTIILSGVNVIGAWHGTAQHGTA